MDSISVDEDIFPSKIESRTNSSFSTMYDPVKELFTYTDLIIRFRYQSSRVNTFIIFLVYDYDANAILAEPILNYESDTIVKT